MKSVALHNLGCKVNSYEIDVMQQRLQESGYKIVPFDEAADVYIINTCTVTNIADRKSRQMIHRARRLNPDAVVVAAGCYVQTAGEAVWQDGAVDIAVGNNRKKDIVSILEEYWQAQQPAADVIDIGTVREYEEMQLSHTAEHTRAYIKIQDGCNQFCSYCIIPYARGRVRSRREEDILREVQGIVDAGYKEIVLTGIHISSYGIDRGGSQLLQLIEKLHVIDGLERIRLGSLEPRIVTDDFAARISAMAKICPHFHLSLQSGCDSVLKRMHRFYSTEEYLEKCTLLRRYYRDPAITTDIIVGFPGETEEEFLCTKEFLETVSFFEMHIFKYSKRFGTKAALMPDQVSEQVKAKRSSQLLCLEKELSNRYRERWIGQETDVLIEEIVEIDGFFYWIGHTMEYIKVAVKIGDSFKREGENQEKTDKKIGQIVRVKLTGKVLEDTLSGRIEVGN